MRLLINTFSQKTMLTSSSAHIFAESLLFPTIDALSQEDNESIPDLEPSTLIDSDNMWRNVSVEIDA
jgi:hypothetical protein